MKKLMNWRGQAAAAMAVALCSAAERAGAARLEPPPSPSRASTIDQGAAARGAQRPPVQSISLEGIRTVHPIAMQEIHADGTTGPWITLPQAGDGGGIAGGPPVCTPYQIAFDSWEIDPLAPTLTPVGGLDCFPMNTATSRYWFGTGFNYPQSISEFSRPAFAGRSIGRVSMPAEWYVNGTGTSAQCYLILRVYETYNECGGVVPPADFLGGVILNYGVLNSGIYNFDAAFCPSNVTIPFPADGSGAVHPKFCTQATPTEVLGHAQPLYWGTQPGGLTGVFTTHTQWDDDPPGGTFECFTYAGVSTCNGNFSPDNMFGLCVVLWTIPQFCTTTLGRMDTDCDTLITNFDVEPLCLTLFGLTSSSPGWGGCSGCAGDLDNDGDVDLSDVATFLGTFGGLP